ncbi:MAG: hypothetical protein O7I93_11375, partial [Gemmatimonadetes bacterium]|nr:hypothetical protein [Gemmatimonadota bacterium]
MRTVRLACVIYAVAAVACAAPERGTEEQSRGPRQQPGTEAGLYAPEQHDLYDGRFVLTGGRIYQAGTLSDTPPWDHMGNDAANVRSVEGN